MFTSFIESTDQTSEAAQKVQKRTQVVGDFSPYPTCVFYCFQMTLQKVPRCGGDSSDENQRN